jgi:hypothetical protein
MKIFLICVSPFVLPFVAATIGPIAAYLLLVIGAPILAFMILSN